MLRWQLWWRGTLAMTLCMIALVIGGNPANVFAQSDSFHKKGVNQANGEYRLSFLHFNSFSLDEEKTPLGDPKNGTWENRLRLAPIIQLSDNFKFHLEIDFIKLGSLYGMDTNIGESFTSSIRSQSDGFHAIDFRQLWFSWLSSIGLFRFGQMGSDWGLGILANSGSHPTGEFSSPKYGDLVLRAFWAIPVFKAFSTSHPLAQRLFFGAAFDVVFRDENAELVEGDIALQGAFSLFYRDSDSIFVGAYFAIRRQEDRNKSRLDVQAIDFFFRWSPKPFSKGRVAFDIAGELAILSGFTDRIRSEQGTDGVNISALAAVARAGLRLPRAGLRIGLELGYASGDNDTGDNISRVFRFDPDYQPSLILFQRLLGAISAHGADRASDLRRVGIPPQGSDQIPSYGRVGNVIYIQPVIAYKPFVSFLKFLRGLEMKVGILYAQAVSDIADPYNSFRAGGVNMTHLNQVASGNHDLGWELNLSLNYTQKIWKTIRLRFALLYGHFFPGDALTDKKGENTPIDLFQARLTVKF